MSHKICCSIGSILIIPLSLSVHSGQDHGMVLKPENGSWQGVQAQVRAGTREADTVEGLAGEGLRLPQGAHNTAVVHCGVDNGEHLQ